MSRPPFVLLHGAFRGGFTFGRVRERLAAEGHAVFTPSFTGCGDRAHLDRRTVTLETHITDVVSVLEQEDLTGAILVGHSYGGFIMTAASERVAARIGHLVYLDAPVPRDGQRASDLVPRSPRPYPSASTSPGQASAEMPVEVPPTQVKAGAEYTEEDAQWVNARLTPMPTRPSFEPITLTSPEALALPRTYVFCSRSPPWIPAAYSRERFDEEGVPYRLLDAGHDAPITAPAAVAALLLEIARSTP